jgi:hypothetical protein
MEKLMPYLEKAKVILDHLEKIVLLAALGALGYCAISKMLDKNSKVEEITKGAPTSPGKIEVGGDMVADENVFSFHESLNTATNTNKTPRLELLKGLSNHLLFSPEMWMTNQSLGLFRADDGERKRGIEAVSVAGPPYSYTMRVWAEVRVNTAGRTINHYVTIQDEYLRYQTTNLAVFSNPKLHPFMPSTNAILLSTNAAGPVLHGSLLPIRSDNDPYRNWLNWTNIVRVGFKNDLHVDRFLRTWPVFPDKFENIILKHPNPNGLKALERQFSRRGAKDPPLYATMYDPQSHPERLVLHFYEHVDIPGTGHYFKMKLYLHPATNFVHFGGEQYRPLQASVLHRTEKEGRRVGPGVPIPRGEFIDLEYGRGTNRRILFQACRPGRKLFIDGQVFVVEAVTQTHVVLGKDPEYTLPDDPARDRKYPLPIPAAPVAVRPDG